MQLAQHRIAFVVSSPLTVKVFMWDQLAELAKRYAVTVITNTSDRYASPLPHPTISVPLHRNISPIVDLFTFGRLAQLFRAERFSSVHSITPKAGALAMTAAYMAGVKVRVHTFTGQVWATRSGPARHALQAADKALARLATHVLVDSPSQCDFLLREHVVCAAKSTVLANGSICGVDTLRFCPDPESRERIRQRLGIPKEAVAFLYVGRLKMDKGVLDLAQAFAKLGLDCDRIWLTIVGPDEEGLRPSIERICSPVASRLHFAGFATEPQQYMAAADVLCLPSYREGFGNVIIEAASVGIPAVASNIYGITDAIEEGVTGLLHTAGDIADLQSKMRQMVDDRETRARMGADARLRAGRLFSKELVTLALLEFYESVVGAEPAGGPA
jgi:glycosyltransferase involved in cell wall biosynthesis